MRTLSRRQFLRGSLTLAGLGLVSGCGVLPPQTQQPPKMVKLGLLSAASLDPSPETTALRQALRELGYVEGQSLTIVPRYGAGKEALASGAAELVGLKPDAILVVGDDPPRAAREATDAIPIVMVDSSDPVGDGLVAGLARPGGNVTGLTSLATMLRAKRLELLRAVVPGASSVAVFWVSNTDETPGLRELQAAAEALGVQLSVVKAAVVNLTSRFSEPIPGRVDGLIVVTAGNVRSTQLYQRRIADFATERRLPAIFESSGFAEAGGLMAYGPNVPDLFRRAAAYVDKILKGARPADLPIEQPSKFDFVVNLKTARALGLTFPQEVLIQATEVIQ